MGGATVEGLIKGERFRNEDITVADPPSKSWRNLPSRVYQ